MQNKSLIDCSTTPSFCPFYFHWLHWQTTRWTASVSSCQEMVRHKSPRQQLSKAMFHSAAWGNPWVSWSTYCLWMECAVFCLPKLKCTCRVQIDSNWLKFALEFWSPYSCLFDRIFRFQPNPRLLFCLKTIHFLHVYYRIQSGRSYDFLRNMYCWLWMRLNGFEGLCRAIYRLLIWQWPVLSSNRWQQSFHHVPLELSSFPFKSHQNYSCQYYLMVSMWMKLLKPGASTNQTLCHCRSRRSWRGIIVRSSVTAGLSSWYLGTTDQWCGAECLSSRYWQVLTSSWWTSYPCRPWLYKFFLHLSIHRRKLWHSIRALESSQRSNGCFFHSTVPTYCSHQGLGQT